MQFPVMDRSCQGLSFMDVWPVKLGAIARNGRSARFTWPPSRHLGQMIPVPQTGLRGDCDLVKKRVSKAGRGNDGVWKAWKAKKPGFPPFPHALEIPSGLPHSHSLDCWIFQGV